MRQRIIFSLLCMWFVTHVYAQHEVTGLLTDSTLQKKIPLAYVYNVSYDYLALADSLGVFSIPAKLGDTLVISSIGYYWKKVIVSDTKSLSIFLEPHVYELYEVRKYASLPFHELQQKILAMPFEEDSLNLGLVYEKYIPIKEYQPGTVSYSVDGLITSVYNSVNRHARNQIRAMELIHNAHTLVQINQKFSKEIVQELTNLPDEYIDEFIVFCSFSDEFLLQTTEYVLYAFMYAKYEDFLFAHPNLQKL